LTRPKNRVDAISELEWNFPKAATVAAKLDDIRIVSYCHVLMDIAAYRSGLGRVLVTPELK
jgi:hypothetical protein